MRVLLVSGSFPPMPCGIGDYTAQLAQALARRPDLAVSVLTDARARPGEHRNGLQVIPVVEGWRAADFWRIRGTLRRWKPDVVHIQYPTRGYGSRLLPKFLPFIARTAGTPVVQTWHEYMFSRFGGRFGALILAIAPGDVVVVRPSFRETMAPLYRWITRRKAIRLIPNASAIPRCVLSEKRRSEVRARFRAGGESILAYFGFVSPHKGVEDLFDIAEPDRHHLVLICDLSASNPDHARILELTASPRWRGRATVTGFLPEIDVAEILSAADAAVFPFRTGAGNWNTSVQAALAQGTFVVATSRTQRGLDERNNVYYAEPRNVPEMRHALHKYLGRRRVTTDADAGPSWDAIASAHVDCYQAAVSQHRRTSIDK
jgi:glycosyltransferase involved in cell wall biosynthesis